MNKINIVVMEINADSLMEKRNFNPNPKNTIKNTNQNPVKSSFLQDTVSMVVDVYFIIKLRHLKRFYKIIIIRNFFLMILGLRKSLQREGVNPRDSNVLLILLKIKIRNKVKIKKIKRMKIIIRKIIVILNKIYLIKSLKSLK